MKYKIILLDADGTLFDYDKAQKNALYKVYRSLNLTMDDAELDKFRQINDQLWLEYEKGVVDMETLKITRFKKLFNNAFIDYHALSNVYLHYLGEGSFELEGAVKVCSALCKTYSLVLLTNGMTAVQQNRFNKSQIKPYINRMITSEETGFQKPDPAIFEYTLKQMGCSDKTSVLMVGDSLSSDIKGGINAGIDTCWYNPKQADCLPEIKPTYEIKDLEELLSLLQTER